MNYSFAPLLIFGIGGQEIIIVLIIVLVLFGGRKIPQLMRGLGKGVSEFKKGAKDVMDEVNSDTDDSEETNSQKK